jgi:hypothetical protein
MSEGRRTGRSSWRRHAVTISLDDREYQALLSLCVHYDCSKRDVIGRLLLRAVPYTRRQRRRNG